MRSKNATGYRGVYLNSRKGYKKRYRVMAMIDGHSELLGTFGTPEEASEVYEAYLANAGRLKFKRQGRGRQHWSGAVNPMDLAALLTEVQACCDGLFKRRLGDARKKPVKRGLSHNPSRFNLDRIFAGPGWYYGCARD